MTLSYFKLFVTFFSKLDPNVEGLCNFGNEVN